MWRPRLWAWQWVFIFTSTSGNIPFLRLWPSARLHICTSVYVSLGLSLREPGALAQACVALRVNGPLHFPSIAVKRGEMTFNMPGLSPPVHINVNLSDLESPSPYNAANVPRALGCNQRRRSRQRSLQRLGIEKTCSRLWVLLNKLTQKKAAADTAEEWERRGGGKIMKGWRLIQSSCNRKRL